MISCDLVIGLHLDIVHRILSDWINVVDLASLDCAYCSAPKRQLFLEVLSNVQLCTMSALTCGRYKTFLDWALDRCVCLADLTIPHSLNEKFCESVVKRICVHVKEIDLVVEHTNTSVLRLILWNCKKLVKLSCYFSRDLRLISDILRGCTSLSEVHLTFSTRLKSPDFIPDIVQSKTLVSVTLKCIDMNDPVACYILQCAPNMRAWACPPWMMQFFVR